MEEEKCTPIDGQNLWFLYERMCVPECGFNKSKAGGDV